MSELDSRIRRGLERLGEPADPGDVFEVVARRKRRRTFVRRAQRFALVIAVLAGSAGGALALNRAFQGGEQPGNEPSGAQLIAFVRRIPEGDRIFVMRPDGSGVKQLIPEMAATEGKDQWGPAWSPNGEWLAFSDSWGDIYKVRADGSELTRLLSDHPQEGPVSAHEPSWSPDGDEIVYTTDAVDGVDRPRMAIVRADGTERRELDTGPGNAYMPAWSPNGRTIAFVTDRAGDPDIYIFDLQTGASRPFVRNPGISDLSPSWSPDGNQITYVSEAGLYVADNEGITHAAIAAGSRQYAGPAWSPDGQWIILAGREPGTGYDIYRVAADPDARAERITTDASHESEPAWQPSAPAEPIPAPSVSPSPSPSPCRFQAPGSPGVLWGDLDGDGFSDRAHLALNEQTCRYSLNASRRGGSMPDEAIDIAEPEWTYADPRPALLMLVQLDGRPGLEVVLDISPDAVYRVARVFRLTDRGFVQMELREAGWPTPAWLFPFDDEMPIGIDCSGEGIVFTRADYSIAEADTGVDPLPFTRTFLEVEGRSFVPVRTETVGIPADAVMSNSGASSYPELGGEPFRSCPGIVE